MSKRSDMNTPMTTRIGWNELRVYVFKQECRFEAQKGLIVEINPHSQPETSHVQKSFLCGVLLVDSNSSVRV